MSKREEFVGLSEFAELLGVTKQSLHNWKTRWADFPKPYQVLRFGPIWRKRDIEHFATFGSPANRKLQRQIQKLETKLSDLKGQQQ